jgi:hypothetical protein
MVVDECAALSIDIEQFALVGMRGSQMMLCSIFPGALVPIRDDIGE